MLAIISSGHHLFGPATPLLYATCLFKKESEGEEKVEEEGKEEEEEEEG